MIKWESKESKFGLTLKSINVTYHISGIKSKNIIISVDTVKAFDKNSTLCHESKQMKL